MRYDLLLIVILTDINNETLCKPYNFYPLLIAELIQTRTLQEEEGLKILLLGGAVTYSGVSTFGNEIGLQIDHKVIWKFLDTASTVQCCEHLFFWTRTSNNETKCKFHCCFVTTINVLFFHFLVYDDLQMIYIYNVLIYLKW